MLDPQESFPFPFTVRVLIVNDTPSRVSLAVLALAAALAPGLQIVTANSAPMPPQVEIRAQASTNSPVTSPASAAASQSGNSAMTFPVTAFGDYTAEQIPGDDPASYRKAGDFTPNIRPTCCKVYSAAGVFRCSLAGA